MNKKVDLRELLPGDEVGPWHVPELFVFFNLGVVDALMNGLMEAEDAVRYFYHADNCLYVKKQLKNKVADRLMGHGVQLPDLFDGLPIGQARREFLRELATMRELCLRLLEERRALA